MTGVLTATAVAAAATVLAWPVQSGRARQRRLGLAGGGSVVWRRLPASLAVVDAWAVVWRRLPASLAVVGEGRLVLACAALGAGVGGVAQGPVAALITAVYAALAARAAARHRRSRAAGAARTRALDELAEVAADLRAGLPPPALPTSSTVDAVRAVWRRASVAVALAETTGAPLADLLERIEADGRAADRAAASAAGQSAGARVTAWLLGALPMVGVALGYAIGADPLHVLLHTPLGAACAAGAVALQLAGVAWVDRLARPVPAEAPS